MRRVLVRMLRKVGARGSRAARPRGVEARALTARAVAVSVAATAAALVGPLASAAAADSGPWAWPLAGPHEVSRPFAPPASAYGPGHRGADLPSAAGSAVRASAVGRVTYAGLLAGRGVVVVTHGALRTTYEPVAALVEVGDAVALGEVLGQVQSGHLGCPAAACLHWGLRRGEEYLDPVRLVDRGPVRLLPVDAAGAKALGGPDGGRRATGDTTTGGAAAAGLVAGSGRTAGGSPAGSRGAERGDLGSADAGGAADPAWSLRADEAPLGVAAVATLLLGIALLARPAPQPSPSPSPPAVPGVVAVPVPGLAGSSVPLPVPVPVVAPAVAPPVPAADPLTPPPAVPVAVPTQWQAATATDVGDAARPAHSAAPVAAVLELAVERERRRPA